MTKKDILIKILTQLEPVRNLASGLKFVVEEWIFDDKMLDILSDAIEWAIHSTKSQLDKEKLEKWLQAINKMKELENESEKQDEKDLKELDDILSNF